MAVIIKTSDPKGLLKKIKDAIDNEDVATWSYDTDGDFTHMPQQWKNKAWLKPKTYTTELRFGLLGPKDVEISKAIYGVYHGRFIEMLLTHFDEDFSNAYATAQRTDDDNFK